MITDKIFTVVFVGFAAAACASTPDSLTGIGEVRLKGYLGERLDAMISRHVAGTDVDYLTAPFMEKTETKRRWQTEFWGKWMHSSVPYSVYLQGGASGKARFAELNESIERGLERILSSQEPDGYIGNYPDRLRCGEGWDVWGMKYTLMGLMHYYDRKGGMGKRALEAAKKLCDYVIAEIGPEGRRGRELWQTGNWSGYASSSILEPVVWLYKRTGERKYLDFASYIVKGMSVPESGPRLIDLALKGVSVADRNGYGNQPETHGGYVMKHNRWKAYEMMSCYQGLLEYREAVMGVASSGSGTASPVSSDDILRAAVMTAEDIAREEVNLAGGCASSEAWFHGARKQHLPYMHLQETCVTTTWMRFCEKLLDVTGDAKWADQIERTFYNAYLGALRADGGEFAAYTPLSGNRWHGMHHCSMHTDCCTANGPRGFLCFLKKFFRVKDGAAEFNFYGSALVKSKLPDGATAAFDMYSLYPRTGYVRIVSHTVGRLPVKFRIPAWGGDTEVKVNEQKLDGVKEGGYFIVERDWRLGDIVEINFKMPVTAHRLANNIAFTRGPVLLARDSRFADGDQTEPFRSGMFRDGDKVQSFAAVRTPGDEMWMAFSATLPIGSHTENPEAANPATVFFCDYASAGNAWRRDNYYRTWFPVELGPSN
jgi:DUF1680 family protein